MTAVRRVAVAVVALAGLVAVVLGVFAAVVLGPSGTATFSARVTGPLLIGADVVGAVDVPVTVTANASTEGSGSGIFIGSARPQDVADVVGGARVQRAVSTSFPDGVLGVRATGAGALPDPTALDVWTATGRTSLVVDPSAGAPAVLVVPTTSEAVTVTVERAHGAWFLEALVLLLLGLLVFLGASLWLVQQLGHRVPIGRFARRRVPRATRPAAGVVASPAPPAVPTGSTQPSAVSTADTPSPARQEWAPPRPGVTVPSPPARSFDEDEEGS